jgi:hypothetical protein
MKKITESKKAIMQEIKDWWWYYGGDVVGWAALIMIPTLIFIIGTTVEKRHCYRAYAQFNPEYVGFTTGCMITVDEQRVPADSLRMTL